MADTNYGQVGGHSDNLSGLFKTLRDEMTLLLRQEVALARTELSEKGSRLGKNVGMLVAGGLVGLVAVIFVLLSIAAAIFVALQRAGMEALSFWLAPLIVGLVVGGIAYYLVERALHTLKNESVVPRHTVESLKEDKAWIAQKAH